MARKAHCPACDEIVTLPHNCNVDYAPNNEGGPAPVHFTGERDEEGRPIGEPKPPSKNDSVFE